MPEFEQLSYTVSLSIIIDDIPSRCGISVTSEGKNLILLSSKNGAYSDTLDGKNIVKKSALMNNTDLVCNTCIGKVRHYTTSDKETFFQFHGFLGM